MSEASWAVPLAPPWALCLCLEENRVEDVWFFKGLSFSWILSSGIYWRSIFIQGKSHIFGRTWSTLLAVPSTDQRFLYNVWTICTFFPPRHWPLLGFGGSSGATSSASSSAAAFGFASAFAAPDSQGSATSSKSLLRDFGSRSQGMLLLTALAYNK